MKRSVLISNFIFIASLTGITLLLSPAWSSEKRGLQNREARYALVIGNSAYTASPLKNPVNDSNDIAQLLGQLGFAVMYRQDVGLRDMETAVREFGHMLETGGTGLFYYAGHGIQVEGRNYLVPVDAKIESQSDVRFEALDVGRVLGKMEDAGNALNIVILDACRDNPFARGFRSARSGLAQMDAPRGTLIAYATAPGSVAADGNGRNGVYTKNLLAHMATPGLPVEQVFKNVRIGVIRDTNQKQVPWESSSLTGNFYFSPKVSGEATGPSELSHIQVQPHKQSGAEKKPQQSTQKTDPLALAYAKDEPTRPEVRLRSKSNRLVKNSEIDGMLSHYGFYDRARHPYRKFTNAFTAQNEDVVIDQKTGLMWQKLGSSSRKSFLSAKSYIEKLNEENFAGYKNWRLPTIEELSSTIESEKKTDLYVSPVFNSLQRICWSSDEADTIHQYPGDIGELAAWIVDYENGTIEKANWFQGNARYLNSNFSQNAKNYVRAVRSIE